MRRAIENHPWTGLGLTASIGVANLSEYAFTPSALIAQADAALYRAKNRGRNNVTCYTDPLDLSELPDECLVRREPQGQQMLNFAIVSDVHDSQTLSQRLSRSYDETVESWSRILTLQDKETEGHSKRVTAMTVRLARAAGMNEEQVMYAKWGAQLHDIGKMGIPETILSKPGPLSPEEWDVMRRHPVMAYEMLSPILFLGPAVEIPRFHHERWDGTGYPCGLRGDEIPHATRLFSVVDVYDALKSDRPYRKAWSESKIRKHLRDHAGTHFDPRAVRTFLKVLEDAERQVSELVKS
jgi:putative nucleotidyltransferase with HDIG domain